jgi:hypothetical protein
MLHFFAVAILKIEWFRSRLASTTTRHIRWQMAATRFELCRAASLLTSRPIGDTTGSLVPWTKKKCNKVREESYREAHCLAHPETGSCARHDYYLDFDRSSRYYSLVTPIVEHWMRKKFYAYIPVQMHSFGVCWAPNWARTVRPWGRTVRGPDSPRL